ncbi:MULTISPECIES: hypothetical protein [unclassified Exiguobacterium]|uniref:hypothetical protein n=1 Tax=unclassified Exiguobacterium TaxID=2644629 RepID=UPI0025BC602D|nr:MULTISPECIES: hypothetical protein [unclassified Exiguobacterium]
MTLQALAERATEVAEAQPRLVTLIELLVAEHDALGLTDEQHATLQDYTNQAMEILRDLGR